MNSVSKVKIAVGYSLLLVVLLFSLFFVHKEMGNLMLSDDKNVQWTDSLLILLQEKDSNTLNMLRMLREPAESTISASDIEQVIARQDTVVKQQRVQRRVISRRDTLLTKQSKKGFFRRLGEVFAPSHKDTSIRVNTTLEYAIDTVFDNYNPIDSLQEKLREVARQKKAVNYVKRRRNNTLQQVDHALTARIDSLLSAYEAETIRRATLETERQQSVRQRSAGIISGIAVGAVLLSVFFLIIIGRDVTRSNRYRRELEEARRRAEELLATREKLMLAITHDFKAPLGSIMGYADLLSRLTTDERQHFYLGNMKTSSEHLLKLVTDLLDFHRLDLHKAEINRITFHPARLLDEIRVSFEPLMAAKNLQLYCTIAPCLDGRFISDPLRLRQILTNLLSNALKFTRHGSVTLTASYEDRKLVVAVCDTGKGMQPEDKERIFQEFTRLPGAQGEEGFGLGLSIVRMLVRLLEGSIEVESEPDKGSTFTLRIPLYPVGQEEPLHPVTPTMQAAPAAAKGGCNPLMRVLLIDDDRIQLTLTAAMLSQSGIAAVDCLEPSQLLEALRTDSFDVLLTDVQMPAMSGFELLKLLRASQMPQARTIPVIAVTARSDMKREEFVAHGFAGCLHKPFSVGELLQELNLPLKELPDVPVLYQLSGLTAFSEGDKEAERSILESFVSETRLNAARLQKAIDNCHSEEVAAVSHKMIPVFALIGASQLVALLQKLEAARNLPFTDETKATALSALLLIEEIVAQISAKQKP